MRKKLSLNKTLQFFCCDVARGLFTGMIANYLLYFFQPIEKSGIPYLLPNSKIFGYITILALITGISKVVDAVTDPLIANLSDKSRNPKGRRIPFMQISAIPFALCVVLIFYAPFGINSVGNAIWVAFFTIAYYVFYTIFCIPQRALIPEIIPDPKIRVNAYAISTVFFMGSSMFMYAAPLFVSIIKSTGLSALWSWRVVFTFFGLIGLVCLLISAFSIKEKDYIEHSNPPQENFLRSCRLVFKNKTFMIVTLGDLFNYIAMAFFQSTLMYYMTFLIGIPESQTIIVMAAAIVTAIAFFPLIMHISKKYSKKIPILIASGMFACLFTAIFFGDKIPVPPLAKGIAMGVLVAFPFAAINIVPQAIVSDVIQADSLATKTNREGIYAATKTFLEKIAYAIALIVVSSVLSVGAIGDARVGLLGVKLTGVIAGVFSLLSFVMFSLYNDKKIISYINSNKKSTDEIVEEEPKPTDN